MAAEASEAVHEAYNKLKVIEIENIKGISQRKFELNIIPNKPSILVAPNGFGKSLFATAFNSMNNSRIKLHDDDLHSEIADKVLRLSIFAKKK